MSKARNLSDLLDANGDVKASSLDNVTIPSTLQDITDNGATSTDTITVGGLHVDSTNAIELPAGTTAERPAGVAGMIRFNTTIGYLEGFDGTSWYAIAPTIPSINSSSGVLYSGQYASTDITLTGSGFLIGQGTVNFTQASDGIDVDVSVTPTNDTSLTVTVPTSVTENVTAGNDVTITFTNDQGGQSNGFDITATAAPTGGTVTSVGNYRVHTFNSSDTFVVGSQLTNVEYLVVAGGGAGAVWAGAGGGGAGGYRCSVPGESSGANSSAESPITIAAGSHTITVGAGGAGGGGWTTTKNNGNNSSIGTAVVSIGGGGAGVYNSSSGIFGPGRDGGSGGACVTGLSTTVGTSNGTSGQGYGGGGTNPSGSGSIAYGRGAGGAGENKAFLENPRNSSGTTDEPSKAGHGGDGLQSSIDGTATYRAGGGGGGTYYQYGLSFMSVGSGGNGGGGDGIFMNLGEYTNPPNKTANAGAANTGGGAGGTPYFYGVSAAGGSGVVIIRYQL